MEVPCLSLTPTISWHRPAADICYKEFLPTIYISHTYIRAIVEKVSIHIIKQQDNITSSRRETRVDKDIANATACMDLSAMSVIESYSTQYFTFKLTSQPTATPQARSLVNASNVMRRVQTSFIFLPPRLEYSRMYANHNAYNALLACLEERQLG